MKKKRLLFFVGNLNKRAGTERVVIQVMNSLHDFYDINVVSFEAYKLEQGFSLDKNISIISIRDEGFKRGFFNESLKLRRIVKEINPDIFISVESMLTLFSFPSTIFTKVKLINWEHFNFNNRAGSRKRPIARRIALLFFDLIIVLTDKDKNEWQKHFGFSKVQRIYNPMPVKFDNGFNVNSKRILTAGRLVKEKRIDKLLLSWSLVKDKNGNILEIAGDGPEKNNLVSLASKLGVANSVRFVGQISDMKMFYQNSKLFVLTSKNEGFGLVLTEALSNSIPVISFNCPVGPSEIIVDSVNGNLIGDGDHIELSRQLQRVIDEPNILVKYSTNAIASLGAFDSTKVTRQWREMLDSL
ncbi:glycosyltransferase family 4 protein [Vibrio splendidus]|uniref:glycosyltransferase family 4 protein n=1 Tax=Vibrio splendidus TaxID=29497 RepID=UPI000C83E3A7|nr:glycosyltransferase family 4 protein [Vibrio splendidus]PMK12100.1 hypothetical protein BCU08_05120 [Vibrio splendidus]